MTPPLERVELWTPSGAVLVRRGRPDRVLGYAEPGTYKPDLTNTGPPSDVGTLTVINGDVTLSSPQILDRVQINGFLNLKVPGTGIRRSKVMGRNTGNDGVNRALIACNAGTGGPTAHLIEDVEVCYAPAIGLSGDAALTAVGAYDVDGIKGRRFTASRVNVHHCNDTVMFTGDDPQLLASYLWHNFHLTVDPNFGGSPSHDDGIQIQGGARGRVIGNNIEGAHNSSIQTTQDAAVVTQLQVLYNWMGRGQATTNFADKGKGPFIDLHVNYNRFRRDSALVGFPALIPRTTFEHPTFEWLGNVWDDDDTPAVYRNGGPGS